MNRKDLGGRNGRVPFKGTVTKFTETTDEMKTNNNTARVMAKA
jgi:hypothetical protein